MKFLRPLPILLLLLTPIHLPAADEAPPPDKAVSQDATSLDGFKFGVAIGFEGYKNGYINDAETVGTDRIVHVTDSLKMKPSVWLETHYIWDGVFMKGGQHRFTHSAPGFYFGVRVIGQNSESFDALSLGLLWSFKRTAIGKAKIPGSIADSINIGIGPVWHRTKRLATGIVEGQPLPPQYQDIKYNKRDEVSWMLMISVGF